jgi:hypothetical protein
MNLDGLGFYEWRAWKATPPPWQVKPKPEFRFRKQRRESLQWFFFRVGRASQWKLLRSMTSLQDVFHLGELRPAAIESRWSPTRRKPMKSIVRARKGCTVWIYVD